MISQLIIRKEPFLIKQKWAILHSRSVHLLVLKLVRKQQGIGLYNELQCGFSFCLHNIFLTNELASSSLHQRADAENPRPSFPFLVFSIKPPHLSMKCNTWFYPSQTDTAEYSSGLFWRNKTDHLQSGEWIISLKSFSVFERHRWGWVIDWILEGECTFKSNLELMLFFWICWDFC